MKRTLLTLALILFIWTPTWASGQGEGAVDEPTADETAPVDAEVEGEAPADEEPGGDDDSALVAPVEEDPAPIEEVDAPETIEDAAKLLDKIVAAAQGGHWSLFAGLLVMFLVFILDRIINLKSKVGNKAMPWVSAGFGVAAAIGLALASGLDVGTALIQGFLVGATGTGLWELVFQHFLKRKTEAPADPAPADPA